LGFVRISKKVEGVIGIEKGSFSMLIPFRGDNTSRAVIVPGTTIGRVVGGTPPCSKIRAFVIGLKIVCSWVYINYFG